ncbi:MAG: CCA tRNA nucleotidyltransferase [Actinomycetota bacterium]
MLNKDAISSPVVTAPEIAARLREIIKLPPEAEDLARRFEKAGKDLYLVGGSVRDAVLGRLQGDLDFTTNASVSEIEQITTKWADARWDTGIQFGTVGISKGGHRMEITTFRGDRYTEESRKPEISAVGTIEEDLIRRDFTVNSMALKLPDRALVDPFGGVGDLASRVLRTPLAAEVSFSDDPLRMLRAARFAATLEFSVDPSVIEAMQGQRDRLRIVSAERVRDELIKLLAAKKPSIGLNLATQAGLSELFLPELPALRLQQDPIHHHKDVYGHTLAVVDKLAATDPEGAEPDVVLRMAGLLHDIGKPATRRFGEDGVSFHHHEVVGGKMATKRLRELRFANDFVEEVSTLVHLHLRFHTFRLGWSDSAVRRYVRDAGPLLHRLNLLVRADCTTRNATKAKQLSNAMDELELRIATLARQEDLKRIRPPIDGNEVMERLGVPPGPIVGRALDFLLEHRLEHGEYSREEAFLLLDNWIASQQ